SKQNCFCYTLSPVRTRSCLALDGGWIFHASSRYFYNPQFFGGHEVLRYLKDHFVFKLGFSNNASPASQASR
ncbi:hypothetical protein Ancab_026599, partial [Ancistrocladus abbreviatus]